MLHLGCILDRTLDADARLTSRTVAGGPGVGFAYDADGLLTGAGALTLSREAASGLLSGTSLGSLSTSLGYNDPFGERAGDVAASVRLVVNVDTGAVAQRLDYDELGRDRC